MIQVNLKKSKISSSEFSRLQKIEMALTVFIALGVITMILLPELGL